MTFIELEDAPGDPLETIENNQTIDCSWCGEVIRVNGSELALAMCQSCYKRMLDDYVLKHQPDEPTVNASDR